MNETCARFVIFVASALAATIAGSRGAAQTPDAVPATSKPEHVRSLLERDAWRLALERARRFAAEDPSDPAIAAALGEALVRAGRLREASEVLARLEHLDPPQSRALVALGRVREAEGRDGEAASLMERALVADPDDRHVLYWAAGTARTRARTVELLERYLGRSEGDDRDRVEAARGIIETYRRLGERRVWIVEDPPSRVSVPLRPIGGAGRTTGYVLQGTLAKGKRARLLLDTGATGLFLVHRLARRGGFAPLAEDVAFGGAGEGRHRSRRGLLPTFAVGGLRFGDALVSTTPRELEATGRYHGTLGISVFRGYRVTLDLGRNRLLLDEPADEPSGKPYWEVSGQILVEGVASDGQSGLFLLDTGAFASLVSTSLVVESPSAELGRAVGARGYGGAISGARRVRGLGVHVLGLELDRSGLMAIDLDQRSRLGGVEVSGFVGLDVLAGSRVVIDTIGHTISVLP